MSWQNPDLTESPMGSFGSFLINERCFIRKEHKCGKMFGASKSCFIACPTNDDLEPILGLMYEKLIKVGIEPIIAVKERAYGQDIFCTKICGKIIESRFCIVILDDSIKDDKNIPNPNVYYEYGLMTALRKHIIPLQKEDLELAFNIQSYDTIKYNNKNITKELDSAIRDAITLTEAMGPERSSEYMDNKFISRRMELAGFTEPPYYISNEVRSIIDATGFMNFWHAEEGFIVFLGKVDNKEDLQSYLDDLGIVILRAERQSNIHKDRLNLYRKKKPEEVERVSSLYQKAIDEDEIFLKSLSTIFIGFVSESEIDLDEFLKSASMILKNQERYKITRMHNDRIQFGEVQADFARTLVIDK
jgi:hypothetical protein